MLLQVKKRDYNGSRTDYNGYRENDLTEKPISTFSITLNNISTM